MGWSNYIIIQKLKLIIETSRNINEIYDFQKKALGYLIDDERTIELEEQDISNINIKNISIKDLAILFSTYEQAEKISGMEEDKFLLYWLGYKNIDYKIISEFEITKDIDEYKKTYTIIRMYEE